MINIVTELLERELDYTFQSPCSQNIDLTTRVKNLGISKQYEDESVNIFFKRSTGQFFCYYQTIRKSKFLPFAKKCVLNDLIIYICT